MQLVTGVQIEFKGDIMRRQSSHRPSIFNGTERAIVQTEIDKLIAQGVIVPSSPEKGKFVSTIFLRGLCKVRKRTADSGHILVSVCNFRLEHFLALPNETSEPKDPSILRFTQTNCKYVQIIIVQRLARQGILINCRLELNQSESEEAMTNL